MSDYADEMDARGQDHDLTTGDPKPTPELSEADVRRLAGLDVYGNPVTFAEATDTALKEWADKQTPRSNVDRVVLGYIRDGLR